MRELGSAFADGEVVSLYRHRPPYPRAVLGILARFMVEPRAVFARHGVTRVRYDVVGFVAWGRPS